MQVFDLKGMKAFPFEERDKNVFFSSDEFRARITELPPGGGIARCEMSESVLFYVIRGAVEVTVDGEPVNLSEGNCLVTGPATVSMSSSEGVRLLGVVVPGRSESA